MSRRTGRRSTPWPVLVAGLLIALAMLPVPRAAAQTPEAGTGRITGTINLGTEDAALSEDVSIDFIVLQGSEVAGTIPATVEGDVATVEVPLDAARRYLPRVTYEGVAYIGAAPVQVTAEQPEVQVDLPVVYAAAEDATGVRGLGVSVSLTRVNFGAGELLLQRTDAVVTDRDRTYTGGASGATYRIPLPEGTLGATGESLRGDVVEEGGLLVANVPIPPGETTIIASEFTVSYEVTEDEYVLRVTVPFATERVQVVVPSGWVHRPEVDAPGFEGEPTTGTLEDGTPVTLRTFVLEDAGPGDSLVLRLDGLAPSRNSNPLTEPPGSIIAGAVALVMVGGASVLAVMRAHRDEGRNEDRAEPGT